MHSFIQQFIKIRYCRAKEKRVRRRKTYLNNVSQTGALIHMKGVVQSLRQPVAEQLNLCCVPLLQHTNIEFETFTSTCGKSDLTSQRSVF